MTIMPKYRSKGTERNGLKFGSIDEADRYDVLLLDLEAGDIRKLKLHPAFVLAPKCVLQGKNKPALRYFADFSYEARSGDEWVQIVEDVKSEATRRDALYRAKLHLMKTVHDIEVEDVR